MRFKRLKITHFVETDVIILWASPTVVKLISSIQRLIKVLLLTSVLWILMTHYDTSNSSTADTDDVNVLSAVERESIYQGIINCN